MRLRIAFIAGVAGVSLTACGSGARSDSQIVKDFNSLMQDKGYQTKAHFCTHQSGNQYICKATTISLSGVDEGTAYYNVTDDGKSIFVTEGPG